LSPPAPPTVYYGGNHVFKSTSRGDQWERISPDLTRGGPGPSAYSGHTITTLAESPLKAGLLYAGTDDGKLWVSDDGKEWTDLSNNVPDVDQGGKPGRAGERWINRRECSHFGAETAYLASTRHRNDDLK